MTEHEIFLKKQWLDVKRTRNLLLSETDWTQIADSACSPEKVAELKLYRQELRDIPQKFSLPSEVVWPKRPIL